MFGNSIGFRFKLIAILISVVITLGMISFFSLQSIYNHQKQEKTDFFSGYASSMSNAIAAQFYERYGDVQAFAMNSRIYSGEINEVIEQLNSYAALYGIYDLIMFVNKEGRLIAVNNKKPNGESLETGPLYNLNYSDTAWFKAVLSGEFTEDKEKLLVGTYVEPFAIDEYATVVYGQKKITTGFSSAVKNKSGEIIGVLTNRAGLRWAGTPMAELYDQLKMSGLPHSKLALVSKSGQTWIDFTSNDAENFNLLEPHAVEKFNTQYPEQNKEYLYSKQNISGAKFVDHLNWRVFVLSDRREVFSKLDSVRYATLMFVLFIMFVMTAGALIFAAKVNKTLSGLAQRFEKQAETMLTASLDLSVLSNNLSEAVSEQASAIQETAASLDEVSSMINNNSGHAKQSRIASTESRQCVEVGQKATVDLLTSIQNLSQSQDRIVSQVEESHNKTNEIIRVISDIGEKTKVINDIVFQTKLLSFNASVEAARAGEHGKGFAVVAEEVGNLAQMSGRAATEISQMLSTSVTHVQQIAKDTKSQVEVLVREAQENMRAGQATAQHAKTSLDKILSGVQTVESMATQISNASQEQSLGILEINKAMNQLDEVMQKNSSIANTTSSSSGQIKSQSIQMKKIIGELNNFIYGSNDSRTNNSVLAPTLVLENAPLPTPTRTPLPVTVKTITPSNTQRNVAVEKETKKLKVVPVTTGPTQVGLQAKGLKPITSHAHQVQHNTNKVANGVAIESPLESDRRFEDV